jgi:lipopolysaccharide export system protein LptC
VTFYRYMVFLMILIVLAAASWWALTVFDPERYRAITTSKEGPDHFMEDFVSTTLGLDGTPRHKLVAQRLTHFPNKEHSDLLAPEMTFYNINNNTWIATAKHGRILDDGNEVFLQGDVFIQRPGQLSTLITINTSDLHILPNKDIAETPHSVVMQQDKNTITSTGMFAHFGLGEVDLLSEVRGWYVN